MGKEDVFDKKRPASTGLTRSSTRSSLISSNGFGPRPTQESVRSFFAGRSSEGSITSSWSMGPSPKRRSTKAVQRALFGPITKKKSSRSSSRVDLNVPRRRIHEVIDSITFKCIMAAVVIFNIWLVAYDTDLRAIDEASPFWVEWTSRFCLMMYSLDLCARIYSYRAEAFYSKANWFDFFIIASDIIFEVLDKTMSDLPSLSILRIVRVMRAVRIMREFMMFRELYLMMRGILSALRAIIFATILIAVVLTMWSIVAVEMMHKINTQLDDEGVYSDCERCRNAFVSVGASNLTFLKGIIAGDSWGEVSIPLMEAHPWTALIILSAFLSIQLGLLNVIVAVIVDRLSSARADDEELVYTVKQEQLMKSYANLIGVFKQMDADGSGSLTLGELQQSYQNCEEFKEMLDLLDIGEEDLVLLASILDRNRDGEIGFEEFVHQLHALRSRDSHTLLIFIKHYAAEIWSALEGKHAYLLEQVVRQNDRIINISGVDGYGEAAGHHGDEGDIEKMKNSSQPPHELPQSKEQADRSLHLSPDYRNVNDATLRNELKWLHRHLDHQLRAALSETAHRLSALSTGTVFALDVTASAKWEPLSEAIPSEKIPTGVWDFTLHSGTHHCLPDKSVMASESTECGVPEASYKDPASFLPVSVSQRFHVPESDIIQASRGPGGTGYQRITSAAPQVLAASVGSNEAESSLMVALSSACASCAAHSPQTLQPHSTLSI